MLNVVVDFVRDNFMMISFIIGGLWAFYQWHISLLQKDAELLKGHVDIIRSSKIREFVAMCDYEIPWYSKASHQSDADKNVDYALTMFSSLCYLRKCKLMSKKAFDFFRYDYELVFSDGQVIDYMYNLFHDARKRNMSFPFKDLIEYGFKEKMIGISKSEFEDPKAYLRNEKLHNYLDFLNETERSK